MKLTKLTKLERIEIVINYYASMGVNKERVNQVKRNILKTITWKE